MAKKYFVGDIGFGSNPELSLTRKVIWEDPETMNEDLLSNWNETVKEEDHVFILGEFFNFSSDKAEQIMIYEKLNGHKLHIQSSKPPHNKYSDIHGPVFTNMMLKEKNYLIQITNNFDIINRMNCNFSVISSDEGYIDKKNEDYIYYEDHINGTIMFQSNLSSPIYNVCIDLWDFSPVPMDELFVYYSIYKKSRE